MGVHTTHGLRCSRTITHQSVTMTQRVTYLPGRELCPAAASMSCCNALGLFLLFGAHADLSQLQPTQSPSDQVWSPRVDPAPLWHVSSLALDFSASFQLL